MGRPKNVPKKGLNISQLRDILKTAGVKFHRALKKAQLVDLIKKYVLEPKKEDDLRKYMKPKDTWNIDSSGDFSQFATHKVPVSMEDCVDEEDLPLNQEVEIGIDGVTSQLTYLTDLMESELDKLGDAIAIQDVRHVLQKVYFSAMDFWEGYKYYCIGYYAKSTEYQRKFLKCKMGDIICRLYKEDKLWWNINLDEKIRKAWFIMEEYVMETERFDCRDLESLIKKYDDPAKLATTEHGRSFLELCKSDGCSTRMPNFIVAR